MISLKEALGDFKALMQGILLKKIDFNAKILENEFDFKRKEREYYSGEINSALRKLEALLSETFVVAKEADRASLARVADKIKELKQKLNQKQFQEVLDAIDALSEITPNIKISESDLPKSDFFLPHVPREIYAEVKASFDELLKCYEHNCYRSSLILCGRLLEIIMHYKYKEKTNIDLLEKAPDLGLGNLILKFKEKNIELDPGLSNQIHLINQLRVASVHKKKHVFNPTKAQCKASILYTLDVLKKIFKN